MSCSLKAMLPFQDRVLAASVPDADGQPFLTVAVPHYKHRSHLELVLDSVFEQTFDDFEIVISDDRSPDDSNAVIPELLMASKRSFRYYAQPTNLGYDGNVRFCLGAAQGHYVLMLGNDDALASPTALEDITRSLSQLNQPEVALTNFADWASGVLTQRVFDTRLLGAGAETAVRFFRSFSFVSGLIFKRASAHQHETDRWDRSIYYQIYLACRILAAGGRLGALNVCAVHKDVQVDGQTVANYKTKWADAGWSWQFRHTGMDSAIRVTADAVLPFLPAAERSAALRRIIGQVLMTSYPYWLFEYRWVANWSFAAGVARGMWPGKLSDEYALAFHDEFYLWLLYLLVTATGLIVPAFLFNAIRDSLARFVRWIRQTGMREYTIDE